MVEGAGEDPFLGSELARAYVRGYQGKRLSAPDSMAACAKHYVGYGAAEGGRDYNTAEISEHTLREIYLPPFYAALDEDGATVMSSFNPLNGIPASTRIRSLSNRSCGKNGSSREWWSVTGHHLASSWLTELRTMDLRRRCGRFFAGVDMDMESNIHYHQFLADLVRNGKVTEAQLDDAVRHVLRVKLALGLFDQPYTDETRKHTGPLDKADLELTRTAAERSFVLLKNGNSKGSQPVLPLKKNQTVALIGPLADDAGNMLGSWAGRGQREDVVTLRSALTEAMSRVQNWIRARRTDPRLERQGDCRCGCCCEEGQCGHSGTRRKCGRNDRRSGIASPFWICRAARKSCLRKWSRRVRQWFWCCSAEGH